MSKVEDFLTKAEEAQVVEAIRLAEKNTSGEIRIHIETETSIAPIDRAMEVFHNLKMDLTQLRDDIHNIDNQLIELLAKRNQLVIKVGKIKMLGSMPVLNNQVFEEKMKNLEKLGKGQGLSAKFIRRMWRTIYHTSIKTQENLVKMHLKNNKDK